MCVVILEFICVKLNMIKAILAILATTHKQVWFYKISQALRECYDAFSKYMTPGSGGLSVQLLMAMRCMKLFFAIGDQHSF